MMKKIFETLVLITLAVVIPLIGQPQLLTTWPMLTIILFGILLNMSQPAMASTGTLQGHDRYSMVLILVGAILCFAIPLCDYAYGKPKVILLNQAATWLGLAMIYVGLAFRYWSIRVLGRFFTAKVEIQSDHQLIQSGPYRYLRHPSYTGAWTSMVGISLFLQSKYGLVFSIFVYFLIYIYRIECEERALGKTFGEKYEEYRKKTWGIWPFVF